MTAITTNPDDGDGKKSTKDLRRFDSLDIEAGKVRSGPLHHGSGGSKVFFLSTHACMQMNNHSLLIIMLGWGGVEDAAFANISRDRSGVRRHRDVASVRDARNFPQWD